METLFYLYGIVPVTAPDSADDLRGVEGAPIRVLREGGIAALVSALRSGEYGDEVLDDRLSDLSWVGERGIAHERVLDWFMETGPVVPLSLFSLHQGEERVRELLRAEAERFGQTLDRLRGRREWGVKLWRDEARLDANLPQLSPALGVLDAEARKGGPGTHASVGERRDLVRTHEMRRVSSRISHEVYAQLRSSAAAATTVALPPGAPASNRILTLHSVYLVADDQFDRFQKTLSELAATFQPIGFDFELTGPWPAYHFAGS